MKRFFAWLLIAVLIAGLTSCADKNGTTQDIMTQTVLAEDKIPVTVLVKYAFSINSFEKAAEEKFPNLDIIQVGNYTSYMGIAEYEARLEHDDLTDVVMTWPLEVGEQYWEDRLIDLSSMPLSGNYNTNMLNNIARDGKLYYLPGPSQVRGIVYNKTLFQEKGWQIPKDYEGFLALCKEIENSGIRSLQLGLGNVEVLDTAFMGFGYGESFSTPEDARWLAGYNEGKGRFGEHFGPALGTFKGLIDNGVLKKEDLNITYADREQMLFTRKCAMIEDSVLMARMGYDLTGSTDEFALMPFFNPGPNNDWARLYPVCYIGVNKHLASSQNKEKYDLVVQLLEYISTPQGQDALAADTGAMFSSLNGTSPPDVSEINDLLPALNQGRYAVFPVLKNASNAFRKGLAGMVEGRLTAADVAAMIDKENLSPPAEELSKVFGTASEDFTLIETGNFITDAMRSKSGCDAALFLDNGKDGKYTGKGVSGRLYKGDVTAADIKRVLPDLKHGEKGVLCEVTMTGEDLIQTLEYAIPVNHNQSGWFYYFSGLKMEYAPAAAPGKRIRKITDDKDKPIDPKKIYSIAVMDGTMPEERMKSFKEAGISITETVQQAVQKAETISPSGDGRFIVCEP